MSFRIYLLFVYTTLCLVAFYHVNASDDSNASDESDESDPPKQKVQIVDFSWGNCGAPADPFLIRSFDLGPDPLRIPGNVTLGMSFSFTNPVQRILPYMLVVMEKYVIGFWIKVPCQKNIGSCTYQNVCTGWSEVCTALFSQFGVPCNCPIPAGTFTIPDFTVEATQTLPPQAVGTFRVYADLLSGSAGQLGCLQFQINISN